MEKPPQQPTLVHVDKVNQNPDEHYTHGRRIYIVHLDFHDGNGAVKMDIYDVLTEYNTSKMRSDLEEYGIYPMIFLDHVHYEQD
jgi:membrane-bound lytic murein transglycosylase B